MMDVTEEQMRVYRETARKRLAAEQAKLERRRERAMTVARAGAEILKTNYGAKEVFLFGSLARNEPFTEHSDVDLAATGLDERRYFKIVAELLYIDTAIDVDLVMMESASESLKTQIREEGIAL